MKSVNLDIEYIKDQLERLLNIASPTGDTLEAISYLESEFKTLGISTRRTNKQALIASIEGINSEEAITLSAHVDTLGAMVEEIKSNARLKISQLGGYVWNTIEGEYIIVNTLDDRQITGTIVSTKASVHVHGTKASTSERDGDSLEIRLDERVEDKQDVLDLGINIGDFVYLDPRVSLTETGFVKSRHLDDKAGVVSILAVAKYLRDQEIKPRNTLHFFISNYEEVGHGASAAIPENTVDFLAIDMAAVGEGQTSDEFSVTICAKDSTGPYDLEFRKQLICLAKDEGLSYKIDIYPSYGSDASAALRAGHDFRTALIGPGVDASHAYERTHLEAIQHTIRLALLYLTKK